VHRGRFGGNARKRKAKLTDATFHAMIGAAPPSEALVVMIDLEAEAVSATIDAAAAVMVDYDRIESAPRRLMPRDFSAQDYQFGYATCANCHNDQAYYLHHAVLADGYTFRCRICRLEMTVVNQA